MRLSLIECSGSGLRFNDPPISRRHLPSKPNHIIDHNARRRETGIAKRGAREGVYPLEHAYSPAELEFGKLTASTRL